MMRSGRHGNLGMRVRIGKYSSSFRFTINGTDHVLALGHVFAAQPVLVS